MAPCDTWDNALLMCAVPLPDVADGGRGGFPMILEMKRIAPGHSNTWFIEVYGTKQSMRFNTRFPRTLETLVYERGKPQAWQVQDLGYESAYTAITGGIFEFGFPDAILQMWAAYCDELAARLDGRAMRQPFMAATAEETESSHAIFDVALESALRGTAVALCT